MIFMLILPRKCYYEIDHIPAISHVGVLVKYKSHGNNFKYCLDHENIGKYLIEDFYYSIFDFQWISIRIVIWT